jgi:hypothetical protein
MLWEQGSSMAVRNGEENWDFAAGVVPSYSRGRIRLSWDRWRPVKRSGRRCTVTGTTGAGSAHGRVTGVRALSGE